MTNKKFYTGLVKAIADLPGLGPVKLHVFFSCGILNSNGRIYETSDLQDVINRASELKPFQNHEEACNWITDALYARRRINTKVRITTDLDDNNSFSSECNLVQVKEDL